MQIKSNQQKHIQGFAEFEPAFAAKLLSHLLNFLEPSDCLGKRPKNGKRLYIFEVEYIWPIV
jgi:hypothetical protein